MSEVRATYNRAHDALAAARYNLEGGYLHTAVNRAYYAAYHAARAALLTVGESPRTHKGVIQRFNLHFVKKGSLPVHIAKVLPYAEDLREGADYQLAVSFDQSTVEDLLAGVASFLQAVEELLPA